jgi:lipoate-protein ligase A
MTQPIKTLDESYKTPAENLACDEVLLNEINTGTRGPLLRFWESHAYFVVVGYGNSIERECDTTACERLSIPILRRISGGGAVMQGPGCLNYSLLMPIEPDNPTRTIGDTNCHIMSTIRKAIAQMLDLPVLVQGHTDLTLEGIKFSGNSQRRQRNALLFHGTFLLDFDISLIEKTLKFPSVTPTYRNGRGHVEFCRNLPVNADKLKTVIEKAWQTKGIGLTPNRNLLTKLVRQKYANPEWVQRRK